MAAIVEKTKVSVPHLAKMWGVSTSKIAGFIKIGELEAINVATSMDGRPRYLIDLAAIERFEQSRQVIPEGGLSTTKRLRRKAAAGVTEYF